MSRFLPHGRMPAESCRCRETAPPFPNGPLPTAFDCSSDFPWTQRTQSPRRVVDAPCLPLTMYYKATEFYELGTIIQKGHWGQHVQGLGTRHEDYTLYVSGKRATSFATRSSASSDKSAARAARRSEPGGVGPYEAMSLVGRYGLSDESTASWRGRMRARFRVGPANRAAHLGADPAPS